MGGRLSSWIKPVSVKNSFGHFFILTKSSNTIILGVSNKSRSFYWMTCSGQYNSQQALPIWTPAWPTWTEIHSRCNETNARVRLEEFSQWEEVQWTLHNSNSWRPEKMLGLNGISSETMFFERGNEGKVWGTCTSYATIRIITVRVIRNFELDDVFEWRNWGKSLGELYELCDNSSYNCSSYTEFRVKRWFSNGETKEKSGRVVRVMR